MEAFLDTIEEDLDEDPSQADAMAWTPTCPNDMNTKMTLAPTTVMSMGKEKWGILWMKG